MFKKILVAQDGSKGSARVMPLAVAMAKSNGAELVIAHVDEQTIGKGGGSLNAGDGELQQQLTNRAQDLTDTGTPTSFEVRSVIVGGPAHALAEIADHVGADLIITGTRGHSALTGVLLGSVPHRLLQIAHQPVLVVPESAGVDESVSANGFAAVGV